MENQTQPVAEAAPTQAIETPPNVITPPNFDAELDAVLSKSFPNAAPQQEEVKQDEPKPVEKPKVELGEKNSDKRGNLELAKTDKPIEAEKSALTPEQVDKMDPKEKGAWGAIKNANKNAHKMIEQRDSEIAKLKSVIAERGQLSQKEVEALKAENADLVKYRAMIDIEADPEFISKFDQPIENITKGIKSMLKSMVLGTEITPEMVDKLDVSNSQIMDKIIGSVEESKDKFVARKMERMVDDLLKLKDERSESVAEQKEKYKETLEAKKKQAFEKNAEGEGRAFKHLESVTSTKDKSGNPMFPFLNKMEIKDTATQPEVDQINNHNAMVDMMHKKVSEAYKMDSPEQRMEVAVAAAAAHYLSAQWRAANAKIKSLQEEIQKISSVTNETEKTKPTSVKRNGHIMDTDQALAAHFGR